MLFKEIDEIRKKYDNGLINRAEMLSQLARLINQLLIEDYIETRNSMFNYNREMEKLKKIKKIIA